MGGKWGGNGGGMGENGFCLQGLQIREGPRTPGQ